MKIFLFLFASLLHAQSDLDRFLHQRGYFLTPAGTSIYEGYITPAQKESFVRGLARHPGLRTIAEVGFNAGHTSEIFLENVPDGRVVSFDINSHAYTNVGVEFMKTKYPDRFQFVEGDSRLAIPNYFKSHPDGKFDLIYIDGCHLLDVCLDDILNFKSLAHQDSVLWIDDTNFPDVQRAVDIAARLRIIEVVKSEAMEDDFGTRAWVEARYLFRD